MYAVVRTGGKQYKVQPGDVIRVEKLEQALGSEFDLTEILMVGGEKPVVGQPVVQNAKVTVVVTKQTRDRKVIIFKKKRRQGYRRFKTHRQPFTELFVKSISLNGQTAKTDQTAQVKDVDADRTARIQARTDDRKARVQEQLKAGPMEKSVRKSAAKKVTKKAAKKTGKKTVVKKKAAKKTAKKTSKKA